MKLINSLTIITLIASLAAASSSQADNEIGSGGETAGAGGGQPQFCPEEGACIAVDCGAPSYTVSCEPIDECMKAFTVCPYGATGSGLRHGRSHVSTWTRV